jgi:hypothetical protein
MEIGITHWLNYKIFTKNNSCTTKLSLPSKTIKLGEIIRTKGFQNDETLPNFIKTKHPTEGENKEQNEMTHDQIRKQKPQLGGQQRGVGKSHVC